MPRVYVPNNRGYDYTPAEKYGEVVFLTEGNLNQFNVSKLYRRLVEALEGSEPDDYWCVGGLTVLNILGTTILAEKHGRINLLLFRIAEGDYIVRRITPKALIRREAA